MKVSGCKAVVRTRVSGSKAVWTRVPRSRAAASTATPLPAATSSTCSRARGAVASWRVARRGTPPHRCTRRVAWEAVSGAGPTARRCFPPTSAHGARTRRACTRVSRSPALRARCSCLRLMRRTVASGRGPRRHALCSVLPSVVSRPTHTRGRRRRRCRRRHHRRLARHHRRQTRSLSRRRRCRHRRRHHPRPLTHLHRPPRRPSRPRRHPRRRRRRAWRPLSTGGRRSTSTAHRGLRGVSRRVSRVQWSARPPHAAACCGAAPRGNRTTQVRGAANPRALPPPTPGTAASAAASGARFARRLPPRCRAAARGASLRRKCTARVSRLACSGALGAASSRWRRCTLKGGSTSRSPLVS